MGRKHNPAAYRFIPPRKGSPQARGLLFLGKVGCTWASGSFWNLFSLCQNPFLTLARTLDRQSEDTIINALFSP